jgi:hypothetical protein
VTTNSGDERVLTESPDKLTVKFDFGEMGRVEFKDVDESED